MVIECESHKKFNLKIEDDVLEAYQFYRSCLSLRKTASTIGTNKTALSKAFKKFNLEYLSQKQANAVHHQRKPRKEVPKKDRVKTCMEKYGVPNPRQNKEINDKIIKKRTESYLKRLSERLEKAECEMLDPFTRVQDKHGKYVFYRMKHKCGHIFLTDLRRDIKCPKCYYVNRFSNFEVEYKEFIKGLGVEQLFNKKILPKYELDSYCVREKIGMEFNGSYWHSVDKKGRNYHALKTQEFLNNGIRVFHFWDYQHPEIIKSIIKSKLGRADHTFYARKLNVKRISSEEARDFLIKSHLDGYVRSSIHLALLTEEGEIVAVLTIRKCKEGVEISRFASKLNCNICGGFSRLFKHALNIIKESYKDVHSITSYCNRDIAPDYKETVYFKNGFSFLGDSGPILKYYNKRKRKVESRQKYQKHRLKHILENYDETLTADENLVRNNIFPIRNSGNWKFEYRI